MVYTYLKHILTLGLHHAHDNPKYYSLSKHYRAHSLRAARITEHKDPGHAQDATICFSFRFA